MQVRAEYAGRGISREGRHQVDRRAVTILVGLIVGVYLGASTVAQIDPFYRDAKTRSGNSSYTIDGWRGADAVPPPVSAATEVPERSFALTWAPAALPPYRDYPVDAVTQSYVGDELPIGQAAEYESTDAVALRAVEGRDCEDCAENAPIPAEPPIVASCADGASGCAAQDGDQDDSATTSDF